MTALTQQEIEQAAAKFNEYFDGILDNNKTRLTVFFGVIGDPTAPVDWLRLQMTPELLLGFRQSIHSYLKGLIEDAYFAEYNYDDLANHQIGVGRLLDAPPLASQIAATVPTHTSATVVKPSTKARWTRASVQAIRIDILDQTSPLYVSPLILYSKIHPVKDTRTRFIGVMSSARGVLQEAKDKLVSIQIGFSFASMDTNILVRNLNEYETITQSMTLTAEKANSALDKIVTDQLIGIPLIDSIKNEIASRPRYLRKLASALYYDVISKITPTLMHDSIEKLRVKGSLHINETYDAQRQQITLNVDPNVPKQIQQFVYLVSENIMEGTFTTQLFLVNSKRILR